MLNRLLLDSWLNLGNDSASILTVPTYEGRVDCFNLPVISMAKIAPNFMFNLPKVRFFAG